MRSRQVFRKENAVNQHPQFRILKIPLCQIAATLRGDFVAHVLEREDIVANGTPITLRTIVQFEKVDDFLLRKPMLGICVFLQYLQYQHIEHFLIVSGINIHWHPPW